MTPKQVKQLTSALEQAFNAEVQAEKVSTKRYRFVVVSPQFCRMTQMERQDAIWAQVDQVLQKADAVNVSLILAYAPNEIEQPA
mgnify:CR=1 FL=1